MSVMHNVSIIVCRLNALLLLLIKYIMLQSYEHRLLELDHRIKDRNSTHASDIEQLEISLRAQGMEERDQFIMKIHFFLQNSSRNIVQFDDTFIILTMRLSALCNRVTKRN